MGARFGAFWTDIMGDAATLFFPLAEFLNGPTDETLVPKQPCELMWASRHRMRLKFEESLNAEATSEAARLSLTSIAQESAKRRRALWADVDMEGSIAA